MIPSRMGDNLMEKTNQNIFEYYVMSDNRYYLHELERRFSKLNVENEEDIEDVKCIVANKTKDYMRNLEHDYNKYVNIRRVHYLLRSNLKRLFFFLDKKKEDKDLEIFPYLNEWKNSFCYFDESKFEIARKITLKEFPEEYTAFKESNNFFDLYNKLYDYNDHKFQKIMGILDAYGVFIINTPYRYIPRPKRRESIDE